MAKLEEMLADRKRIEEDENIVRDATLFGVIEPADRGRYVGCKREA